MPTSSQTAIVILNPASGSSDDDLRSKIEKLLSDRNVDYEIRETSKAKDGKALAAEACQQGAKHILACGGDGTVMAVINGIGPKEGEQHSPVLSIIPAGTANLLAAALQIPADIEKAVAIAIDGTDALIDLGCIDETYFALGIGIGIAERFVSEASHEAKDKMGRLAYVLALAKEVGTPPSTYTVKLDDQPDTEYQGVSLVIANVGEFGGIKIDPNARPSDGFLDICIVEQFTFWDALRLAFRAISESLHTDRKVTMLKAKKVQIKTKQPLAIQIDGESVEQTTPFTATIIPKALNARIPSEAKPSV
ncbi:YegS/Rv2252/BmrU family lipid kinase [soil metagenome]